VAVAQELGLQVGVLDVVNELVVRIVVQGLVGFVNFLELNQLDRIFARLERRIPYRFEGVRAWAVGLGRARGTGPVTFYLWLRRLDLRGQISDDIERSCCYCCCNWCLLCYVEALHKLSHVAFVPILDLKFAHVTFVPILDRPPPFLAILGAAFRVAVNFEGGVIRQDIVARVKHETPLLAKKIPLFGGEKCLDGHLELFHFPEIAHEVKFALNAIFSNELCFLFST